MNVPALASVLLAASIVACAPVLVQPVPAHVACVAAQWPQTTLDDLRRGRTLYATRCGSCHVAPLPSSRPAALWPHVVADMVHKGKVTTEDGATITRFLVAVTRCTASTEPGS